MALHETNLENAAMEFEASLPDRAYARLTRTIDVLQDLVADLSAHLCEEGHDYSEEGVAIMRRRVANALPPAKCPDWLACFRDPPVVKSI